MEPRFLARLPVTLQSARTKDALSTWDVSARGLYLVTPNLLPLRQLVRLSVSAQAGKDLVLHGMVASAQDTVDAEGRPPGMGIELYGLDRASRAAWWDLVCSARANAA